MIGRSCVVTACVVFLLTLTISAWSAGTPEQAKALVEKAITFYEANGKEKALAEFSNPKGQFVQGRPLHSCLRP